MTKTLLGVLFLIILMLCVGGCSSSGVKKTIPLNNTEEISTLKDQVNIMINYAKDALSYFSTADIIKTANDICIYGTKVVGRYYDNVAYL